MRHGVKNNGKVRMGSKHKRPGGFAPGIHLEGGEKIGFWQKYLFSLLVKNDKMVGINNE